MRPRVLDDMNQTAGRSHPPFGEGTRVLDFSAVAPSARLGRDCQIGTHVSIGAGVVVGDRVVIRDGAHVDEDVRIESDVTVGVGATIVAASASTQMKRGHSTLRTGCSVGANATVAGGVTIGSRAVVSDGAVVTKSVPPNAIVAGNPAQIVGYVETPSRPALPASALPGIHATSVNGVTVHHMASVDDLRGNLTVGELGRDVPFNVLRYFLVYGVPNEEVRGEHAHLNCHQFLVAASGSIRVVADDGHRREEFLLDRPNVGLHLPPRTWGIQYGYSAGAVLLVLASEHYDPADYIRDYDEFLKVAGAGAGTF